MSTILEQAQLVSRHHDWTNANYYLQQLLSENVTQSELTIILELALTILIKGDFQQRWDVAKIIPKLGIVVIDPLITILDDEQQEIEARWFAGKILANFSQPEVIICVVNLLITTEVEELREMAAMTLAGLDQKAIAPLATLLSYSQFRYLVTRALAQIPLPEVIEPLLGVVTDADVKVRTIAIEALASFRAPQITPILFNALTDLATSVRKEAVIGLSRRVDLVEEKQLIDCLQPLLEDISLEVSQQTAIALSKCTHPQGATALFTTLQSPHTPIALQLTIIQSLAWQETETSLNFLQQSLSFLEPKAVKEIIIVLARMQKTAIQAQAAKILLEFAQSNPPLLADIPIKQTLAHSLGQLNLTTAIPTLAKLANDQDAGVRLHALNAIKKINQ
jgi:HEAT repeat protein